MEFKLSPHGIPYIELDDDNKIIFSSSTATKDGFKWVVFSGVTTTSVSVSSGKGKKKVKSRAVHRENTSMTLDMSLTGIPKSAKLQNIYLTAKYINGIKRLLAPYVKDGIFLFENIPLLAKDINNIDYNVPEDLLEDDPNGYYEDEGEE